MQLWFGFWMISKGASEPMDYPKTGHDRQAGDRRGLRLLRVVAAVTSVTCHKLTWRVYAAKPHLYTYSVRLKGFS